MNVPANIAAAGLSNSEMTVLRYLGRFGPRGETSTSLIAEDTKIDDHRIGGILRSLLERRLVWRRATAVWAISRSGNAVLGVRD